MQGVKRWIATLAVAAILPGLAVMAAPAQAAVVKSSTLPITVFGGDIGLAGGFSGEVVFELIDENGGGLTFVQTIKNTSADATGGVLSTAWWENGTVLTVPSVTDQSAGVSWVSGGGIGAPNPPGSATLSPSWIGSAFKFGATAGPGGIPGNSIAYGEQVEITFAGVPTDFDFAAYIQEVVNGPQRIAFQIQSLPDGGSAQALVTPVPAALPLFITALAGLGFFGWRRRKAAA